MGMVGLILFLLLVFWLLGYIQIPNFGLPNLVIFTMDGAAFTLLNLLVLIVILWTLSLLPSPFAEIGFLLLLLWLLSVFGVIAITGFPQIILISLIIGLVVYLLYNRRQGF